MSPVEKGTAHVLLPWHEAAWRGLQEAREKKRLPHALLLVGPAGLGKTHMAEGFAQSLLCDAPLAEGRPCGACKGCHLFKGGVHPDFIRVQPEQASKSQEITVGAIRELVAQDAFTSQFGGYKVVLITPADQMNRNAANSLLKTLEEPVPDTVILLTASRPHRLLPTIRSRCQRILFDLPAEEVALAWLEARVKHADARLLLHLAGGMPLAALALDDAALLEQREAAFRTFSGVLAGAREPVGAAAELARLDMGLLLHWIADWISDILRLQQAGAVGRLANPDHHQDLQRLAEQLDCIPMHRLLERVYMARGLERTTANPELMLDDLLVACREYAA